MPGERERARDCRDTGSLRCLVVQLAKLYCTAVYGRTKSGFLYDIDIYTHTNTPHVTTYVRVLDIRHRNHLTFLGIVCASATATTTITTTTTAATVHTTWPCPCLARSPHKVGARKLKHHYAHALGYSKRNPSTNHFQCRFAMVGVSQSRVSRFRGSGLSLGFIIRIPSVQRQTCCAFRQCQVKDSLFWTWRAFRRRFLQTCVQFGH